MDRDLDDEIASHLAEATEEYTQQGLSPDEARRAALRSFGGATQTKEVHREARSFIWLDDFGQDLRFTIRTLIKNPVFTVVVVLTLALGIGANTAIFSVLNGLLLRNLAVHDPERRAHVTDSVVRDTGATRVRGWGYPVWRQLRQRTHVFEAATAWSFTRFNTAAGGETQFVEGIWADGGFFEMLGVPAVLGRTFSPLDDQRGGGRRLLGDVGPIGRVITVYPNTPRALSAQIVGVVADAVYASPREPVSPTWYLPIAQFDVPGFTFASARLSVRAETGSPALLSKSVAAALAAVNPALALTFRPLAGQIHASLTRERLMAQLAGALGGLALLLVALGLYGVVGYGVSRRRTEIAIRLALGAAPAAVVAEVLARVSLWVGVGILAGTGLSLWAAKFVGGLVYGLQPREPTTLVGSAALLCAVGALAVWLPARRATRLDPLAVLRES